MQGNLISCFVVLPVIVSQYSNLSLLIIILYLYFNSFIIFIVLSLIIVRPM